MMFMRQMFVIYLSLGIGYLFCVSAKKQEGVLRTVGYTIGIAILVITLLSSAMLSQPGFDQMCSKMTKMCCGMMGGRSS